MPDLLEVFLFLGFVFGLAAAGVLWLCYVLFSDVNQSVLVPK